MHWGYRSEDLKFAFRKSIFSTYMAEICNGQEPYEQLLLMRAI